MYSSKSPGVALESRAGLTALDGLFNGYNLSDAWRRAVSLQELAIWDDHEYFIFFYTLRSGRLSAQHFHPLPQINL